LLFRLFFKIAVDIRKFPIGAIHSIYYSAWKCYWEIQQIPILSIIEFNLHIWILTVIPSSNFCDQVCNAYLKSDNFLISLLHIFRSIPDYAFSRFQLLIFVRVPRPYPSFFFELSVNQKNSHIPIKVPYKLVCLMITVFYFKVCFITDAQVLL